MWDPFTKTTIHALEMIQRKAVRFIFSKFRTTDSPTTSMNVKGIQTLETRIKLLRLKFLFLLKNKLSRSLDPYLKPLVTRLTRHSHAQSLTPYRARSNLYKYSYFPRTIAEWNQLSLSGLIIIISTESIANFL